MYEYGSGQTHLPNLIIYFSIFFVRYVLLEKEKLIVIPYKGKQNSIKKIRKCYILSKTGDDQTYHCVTLTKLNISRD